MSLTLDEYQTQSRSTAAYPYLAIVDPETMELKSGALGWVYPALKLGGECGEVEEKLGKLLRDNDGQVDKKVRLAVAKELGDIMWYLAAIASEFDITLGEVGQLNIEKLKDRRARGVIHGSGDDR